MPRSRAVYKGKRKYSWIITLVVFLLVFLIIFMVWLFSYLQRYIVYDKDSLHIVLPADRLDEPISPNTGTHINVPKVDVEIVVDRTDYSDLVTKAGENLLPLRALFVAADDISTQTLNYYLSGTGDFNALVLELKGIDGFLSYRSGIPLTDSYGVNGTAELAETLQQLREDGVYLVAQISGILDEAMATRNSPIALKNAITDSVFQNSKGAWLDPYNDTVRQYLNALLRELHTLGFDEVLLSGFYCPDSENLKFSRNMTLTPDVVSALSSLAVYLRSQADEIGLKLSVVADAEALRKGESELIGQDPAFFFRVFDRVVYDSDIADAQLCTQALENALGNGGSAALRIVPAANDYAPQDNSCIVK